MKTVGPETGGGFARSNQFLISTLIGVTGGGRKQRPLVRYIRCGIKLMILDLGIVNH